ncbi:pilus assembly protein PilN [Burkholderia cepacia]|jgi:type IVB pilus formation R64 PilN family outer membrane protein|uniref:hypothetical protein n=1 Tax=Burkholderia TaxID=32008 RepID=UPI000029A009|nr:MULTISPECIES: hypothetical protein [Burkholderia]EKS9798999.1 pilus assembly protein PilN [Burkholderia cepacia]EKS9805953.1 pilus assembly protein PilN [Burkholderia cepacia]EKS9813501.1 pilus assembly protein PilN [Burkholderia cepacia]EKS9820340.1 pilus assembly protein PilN [Burkholderia cepacia]EKS9828205.1 pilus assembly protein PilN [Burkholderia cepacia]
MRLTCISAAVLTACLLSACAIRDVRNDQNAVVDATRAHLDRATEARPVVRMHEGPWLMGEQIVARKPQATLLDKRVSYRYPAGTLAEVAQWITRTTGIPTRIDSSVNDFPVGNSLKVSAPSAGVQPPLPPGFPGATGPLQAVPITSNAAPTLAAARTGQMLTYDGDLGGFLEVQNNRFNVWSRTQDGVITFFRTESRVFPLPSLTEAASMGGQISTGSGSNSSSGTGSSTGSTSSNGSSGSTGSDSGQQLSQSATIDPWKNLQQTAEAISNGGKVVADLNLGMLTVTGTPPQCDRVEAFFKSLNASFLKRIAIDARVYVVRKSREDNLGLSLALAYKNATGHTSAGITGVAPPTVSGSASPASFGANILTGPLAGTKGALQVLSALGDVTEVLSRAGITQNGKLLSLQDARKQRFTPSTQSTLASNVGSTTSQQSETLTTGFTAGFVPKLTNGMIVMNFNITLSQLVEMQLFPPGCSGLNCVQHPITQDTQLLQSVPLKPGETLVLTGMQDQTLTTRANGAGSPWVPILGGGADAQRNDTFIAVVISARLL